jgi:predicted Zn finger-like uncharacterized protein
LVIAIDMRIDCPACAAAYNVPDALLVPGRAVRCLRCGTEWQALAAHPPETPRTGVQVPAKSQWAETSPPEFETPAPNPPVAVPPPDPVARPLAVAAPSGRPSAAAVAFPRLRRPPARSIVAVPEPTPVAIPLPHPHRVPEMTQDGGKIAPVLAWLVSLGVLAIALALLVQYRAAVMAAWPPAGHIFLALGLE